MSRYLEQFERSERYYERFRKLNEGLTEVADPGPQSNYIASTNDHVDDIVSFFIHCYHVKDWIKNDPEVPKDVQQKVEGYVNNTCTLKLCADICNGAKHFSLDRTRTGSQPKFVGSDHKMQINEGGNCAPGSYSLKLRIEHNGETLDAFKLATRAMESWKKFLSDNNLKSRT